MKNYLSQNNVEEFEQLYTRLRKKEGRMYSDEEVALLPAIQISHPHYKEWLIRKHSFKALLNYIKKKDTVLNLLEVGCGNGWLSAQLEKNTGIEVTGVDINTIELEQARRVFHNVPGLNFITGSLLDEYLIDKKYDMIVFGASIQYFASLKQTITVALEHLTLMGEIHIMDSHFYQQYEQAEARQRTRDYFEKEGTPQMSAYYYHHTFNELDNFQFKILHHPHYWKNKLSLNNNPFYWICIKNRYI